MSGDMSDKYPVGYRAAVLGYRISFISGAAGLVTSLLFAVLAIVEHDWWLLTFEVVVAALFAAILRFDVRQLRALSRTRRPTSPPAPQNVCIRYPDGASIPVEVVYLGVYNGTHFWRITATVPLVDGMTLSGSMPAHTALTLGGFVVPPTPPAPPTPDS